MEQKIKERIIQHLEADLICLSEEKQQIDTKIQAVENLITLVNPPFNPLQAG